MFTEVSKSTKPHADNSGNLWPLNKHLPWHGRSNAITAQLYLKFLLVTQPFTKHEWSDNGSSNRTENGNCTNVTNRRSREGLSTPFYTNPLQWTRRQICFGENVYCPAYLLTELCIITDRTNQRSWPDSGQSYVISMEFSEVNRRRPSHETPLWAGSEEGRLFSQGYSIN